MQEPIGRSIEDAWTQRRAALHQALSETTGALRDLLRLDEYHRHGHDPDQLQRALGPLAETSLDLGSLSRVLGGATRSRAMAPERLQRVQALIPALEELAQSWSSAPFDAASIDIDSDEDEIRDRARAHLDRVARAFRALRLAELEIRSKYEPGVHDAMFASFDWQRLSPAEVRLSPPFVIRARLDGQEGAPLRKITALLESGMPIKALALRSSLRDEHATTLGTRVPARMTVETVPMAMRGVYFVQTQVSASDFQRQLTEALSAPRPALISVLCPHHGEPQETFSSRAERAIRARVFPMCRYDPDRHERFVLCFDLSGNPSPELPWTTQTLSGRDSQGEILEVAEPFTVAHFAAFEKELAAELVEPPPKQDSLVSLTEYLGLSRRQQAGKLPFVSVLRHDGCIVRQVVSARLASQCVERLHLWRTLQEISGLDNPHVTAARASLLEELAAQREAQLERLRQEMQADAARRERAAVASAVRKIVAELTGIEPAGT
jgi:pyruvate-ferredoxin/flavodoxin oxidoreductase